MKPDRLLLVAALCLALALSACGGGDSDGSAAADAGSPGATTEQEGTEAPTTTEQEGTEAQTTTGQEGAQVSPDIEAALDVGLGKAGLSAQGVEGVEAEEDGEQAVAVVRMTGGTLDGQTVEVTLSRDKKGWKVDEFARFVDFDKAHLVEHYETETKELPEKFSAKIVSCLTREFGKSSQAEMEAMYLDQDKKLFLALGDICLGN